MSTEVEVEDSRTVKIRTEGKVATEITEANAEVVMIDLRAAVEISNVPREFQQLQKAKLLPCYPIISSSNQLRIKERYTSTRWILEFLAGTESLKLALSDLFRNNYLKYLESS